jgi:hypothetical protein
LKGSPTIIPNNKKYGRNHCSAKAIASFEWPTKHGTASIANEEDEEEHGRYSDRQLVEISTELTPKLITSTISEFRTTKSSAYVGFASAERLRPKEPGTTNPCRQDTSQDRQHQLISSPASKRHTWKQSSHQPPR